MDELGGMSSRGTFGIVYQIYLQLADTVIRHVHSLNGPPRAERSINASCPPGRGPPERQADEMATVVTTRGHMTRPYGPSISVSPRRRKRIIT